MRQIFHYIFLLVLFSLHTATSYAQYCVPQTYYGCYHGYMQYASFSTTGGAANINFSPGGYPNPIPGSNSYPGTCCNMPGEGYTYIEKQPCVATPGSTINFSLHTSNNYPMYYKIWVDFNINGSFTDPGEIVYAPSKYQATGQTLSGSFTIPANATPGLSRLRIAATYYFYGGSPTPCMTFSSSGEYYGTFTDFDFIITNPIENTTSATETNDSILTNPSITIQPSDLAVCAGETIKLSVPACSKGNSYQWRKNGKDIPGATMPDIQLDNAKVTDSGRYDLAITNSKGKAFSSPALVKVHGLPSASIVPLFAKSATASTAVQLSTDIYSSYQWYINNSPIADAHSSVYSPIQAGSYRVFVTDSDDCSVFSAPYNLTTLGVGSVTPNADNIKLYPNPATSVLHIDAPVKVKIVISSLEGQIVIKETGARDVDISKLAIGVYLARIYDIEGTLLKVEKLVKSGY